MKVNFVDLHNAFSYKYLLICSFVKKIRLGFVYMQTGLE